MVLRMTCQTLALLMLAGGAVALMLLLPPREGFRDYDYARDNVGAMR